jgi:hypothetical protein
MYLKVCERALGGYGLALRRLDEKVLEGIAIRDEPPMGFMTDPGDEAAVLGDARERMMDLRLVEIAHIGEAAQAHAVGGDHARGAGGERPDELEVGEGIFR